MKIRSVPDDQDADAAGAVEFVSGEGEEVRADVPEADWDVSYCGGRVGMEQDSFGSAVGGDLFHRLNRADLVVRGHDGEHFVRIGERFPFGHDPFGGDGNDGVFRCRTIGRMLDCADGTEPPVVNNGLIPFRRAGGEDDFVRFAVEADCAAFPVFFQLFFCRPSLLMGRGGVAEIIGGCMSHDTPSAAADWSGSGVVNVDSFHFETLSPLSSDFRGHDIRAGFSQVGFGDGRKDQSAEAEQDGGKDGILVNPSGIGIVGRGEYDFWLSGFGRDFCGEGAVGEVVDGEGHFILFLSFYLITATPTIRRPRSS